MIMRECLRGDIEETWRLSVEGGFFAPSGSLTREEVFNYWREPLEAYWGEQPFTITPEYVARLIETRYSPTGPSANAFRHLSTPPTYAIMSRLDIGVMSLIAELRATIPWATLGAEYFEGADPVTAMGKADRAHREERRGWQPCLTGQPGRSAQRIPIPIIELRARGRRFSGTSGLALT
jgi:hypothetical protein